MPHTGLNRCLPTTKRQLLVSLRYLEFDGRLSRRVVGRRFNGQCTACNSIRIEAALAIPGGGRRWLAAFPDGKRQPHGGAVPEREEVGGRHPDRSGAGATPGPGF